MAKETKYQDTDRIPTYSGSDASAHEYEYKKDYEEDWSVHRQYIQTFDAYEAMLLGQVYDSVSSSVDGSKITDSYAMTLAKERADRVMAKLPDGETEAVGKGDAGKGAFMDILRQKWIYPNANAQHPFFEKLNLWQLYSSVYGYMPMFYDWNVSPTGYVGPDCWLWNPRNLVPQQGRTSLWDMEYVTALSWVGKRFLQGLVDRYDKQKDTAGWNIDALKELLSRVDYAESHPETDKDTLVERTRISQSVKRGICLATRYEAGEDGEWCVFAPDYACIKVRDIKNPHKNGRIPFVIKYSQPLFDSFYGLGDFQRAKPLQFARDGLTNFYFKGIKMNLIPPIVVNANGVLKHTIDYREGGVMMETIPQSVRRLETSTAGLSTYQAAMSNLTGSLLSLYGSQNASIPGSESLNPSQGKTPAAINLYGDKEATRDGAERRHLEAAIEQLTDGFFSLVANIGTEDIPVQLFAADIKEIVKSGLVDVEELFIAGDLKPDKTGVAGELRIKPGALKNIEYRFNITPNSTAKLNREKQLTELERLMTSIGKFQNMFKDDPRLEVNWPAIMKSYETLSDLKGATEFVTVKPGPSPQEAALMQQVEQLTLQLQEMQQQMAMQEQASTLSAPTLTAGGRVFRDPELHAAAQEVVKS